MKCLIVEDEAYIANLCENMLSDLFEQGWFKNKFPGEGYEIIKISSGMEAFEKLKNSNIELAIIDKKLKDTISGIEIGTQLQRIGSTTALVLVTGDTSKSISWLAPDAGFVLTLHKPLSRVEFIANIRMVIQKFVVQNRSNAPWRLDPLTGLAVRRSVNEKLNELRSAKSYGIMLFDIDDFKKINDEHGHLIGDQVIKIVGLRLRKATRDFAGRYGERGDEFIVISIPCRDKQNLLQSAQRIKNAITSDPYHVYKNAKNGEPAEALSPFRVNISGGAAMYQNGLHPEEVLKYADDALYLAKQNGKNQIVVHEGSPSEPLKI